MTCMEIEIPDGFIRWAGGNNPAPGKTVLLAMRPMGHGVSKAALMKRSFLSDDIKGWLHHGHSGDIVAYKII